MTHIAVTTNYHHHHQSIPIEKAFAEAMANLLRINIYTNPAPTGRAMRHRRPLLSRSIICYSLNLVLLVTLVSLASCVPNQQQQQQHRTEQQQQTTDYSTDKQLLKKALDDQGNLSKSPSPSSSSSNNHHPQHQQQQQQQLQQQASSLVANVTVATSSASTFQCPEQFGYYTDTRDCTKYYVCVFGEVLHESCTGGLRFSRELQTCDWPRNVDCPQQQQQQTANATSATSTSTTSLPPAQLLQLKVQAAAAANDNPSPGSESNGDSDANESSNTSGDDEKPAAMKGSSLVFADEGSDPQQPSFDEAVSPVITPDGAIHLHDGSGGTYSLQASGAAAANAAGVLPRGMQQQQPDSGRPPSVDVFVKALPAAQSTTSATARARSQSSASAGSRRVASSNAKLLQPALLPGQRSTTDHQHEQHSQRDGSNKLMQPGGGELSEQQDSEVEREPGSGDDDSSGVGNGGMSPTDSAAAGQAATGAESSEGANQAAPTSGSIGAQADQSELAEERDREAEQDAATANLPLDTSAADDDSVAGNGSGATRQSVGGSSATTVAATTGYIPPVLASQQQHNGAANGLRHSSQQVGPATSSRAHKLSQSPGTSTATTMAQFNTASSSTRANVPTDSSRQFSPAFKPIVVDSSAAGGSGSRFESGDDDGNDFSGNQRHFGPSVAAAASGDSSEMNGNQQLAESRSNGRQNLLLPTGRENQTSTTTSTTTLHQNHPHPSLHLNTNHNHNHLSINLQQQNTRQSRMSSNFKPQQQQQHQQQFTSHMQINSNQQSSIGDMFDGQPLASGANGNGNSNGRQQALGNRFQPSSPAANGANSGNTNSNNNVNDSAKLIRLQSSHNQFEPSSSSVAVTGGGSHLQQQQQFRPSQPFPSPVSSSGRSQQANAQFSQQSPFSDDTAASSGDRRLSGTDAGVSPASHLPVFNQQRRPRPPKRQQIPQGGSGTTNNGNSRKPVARLPQANSNQVLMLHSINNDANNDGLATAPIDQATPTTPSSQTSTNNAAVMQSQQQANSAATIGQFLPLASTPAHHQRSHLSHQQRQQPSMFTTSSMMMMDPTTTSGGQTTRSSSSFSNANNLPPFSQQITRPIVAPTTINFQQQQQQDFSGSSTVNPSSLSSPAGNTATTTTTTTTTGNGRQRLNGNHHHHHHHHGQQQQQESFGNNRNLLNNNNQGHRAAKLLTSTSPMASLSSESSSERPATNLLATTTATSLSNTNSDLTSNDQDQDPELQIDQQAATGNSVGGRRDMRDGSPGSSLVSGSDSDTDSDLNTNSNTNPIRSSNFNFNSNSNPNSNTNSNQNQQQAIATTATATTAATATANQEQDPQLVANRYLNSAIDALEAGQPFGTVDYDFDILNDNSTDNRRNPTSSTGSSAKPTTTTATASRTTLASSAGQSNAQSNSNNGLFYSNPTNANKQRQQRPNQQHSFNRHQQTTADGGGEDGESISLTNGQPTNVNSGASATSSGSGAGVAITNAANQIGLNVRPQQQQQQQQVRANSGGRLATGQHSFAPNQPAPQVSNSGNEGSSSSGTGKQLPSYLATPRVLASASGSATAVAAAKEPSPTKKPRPTNKKIIVNHEQALANNRASVEPAKRPEALFSTPTALQAATKCDNRVCRLPDCKCGDTLTPGGLDPKVIPQVILLTFDDAVNDLNWEIYEELFTGRTNPNGCPILATFYVSHEWTDYGQVQTLYSRGHEMASHSVTHSFGEKFSKNQWFKEVNGQREILNMYGGVKMNDVRGMRAPFLQIGGNKMFEMLYDANFTYDSSMPIFENSPPLWPYTLDYQMTHECMITPCPTKSFPGVWEVGMTMWVDLRGGRCSMGDACSNPPDEDGVYEMLMKNFNRHYKSNRAPFGLFYHSAWFNTVHHRRGFLRFMGTVNGLSDVFFVTNWQMLQWMRKPTPLSEINSFEPWQCPAKNDRPPPCHHPSVCNVKSEHGTRFMKTCQPCPSNQQYPWVGSTGFKNKQASASGSG